MTVTRLWFALGVIALLVSGALSVIISGAKMPLFRPYVTDLELVRRVLVVHVNLATLVWFAAIPVAFTRMAVWGEQKFSSRQLPGFLFSVLGILLMAAAAFFPGANSVLANYIPVLAHPVHDWGLGLFLGGAALTYLSPRFLLGRSAPEGFLSHSRFGLWVGGIFFLSACLALLLAFPALSRSSFPDEKAFFETAMWGGGHLFQHSSAVFLVVGWSYLLQQAGLQGGILREKHLRWIYGVMALPLLTLPYLLLLDPWSREYREGFTQLMRWGMAPAMLAHMVGAIFLLRRHKESPATKPQKLALTTWGLSSFLAVMGFVFGAFIRGSDFRVPGHYHATIGAVTVAFLLISYRLLFAKARDHRVMKPAIWCYGIGQTLFSSGMFMAGAFGMGRKTYGVEHTFTNLGQSAGMGLFALGGLIALVGGVLFGVAVYRGWRESALEPVKKLD